MIKIFHHLCSKNDLFKTEIVKVDVSQDISDSFEDVFCRIKVTMIFSNFNFLKEKSLNIFDILRESSGYTCNTYSHSPRLKFIIPLWSTSPLKVFMSHGWPNVLYGTWLRFSTQEYSSRADYISIYKYWIWNMID